MIAMRSKERLRELGFQLLQDMYQASEPPLDFIEFYEKLRSSDMKCPNDWFTKHEIYEDKYVVIRDRFYKEHKITEREKKFLGWLLFDYSPAFKLDDHRKIVGVGND